MNLSTLIDTFMWFHACKFNSEKYSASWFVYDVSLEGLKEELRCSYINSTTNYLYTVNSALTPIIVNTSSFLEEIDKLSSKQISWKFFEESAKCIPIVQEKPFDVVPSIERISNLRELKELMRTFPYEEREALKDD